MRIFTDSMLQYDNDTLRLKYVITSPDVAPASIVHSPNSGRNGAGGITFTAGDGTSGFAYPMYIGTVYDPVATIISQQYVAQTASQGSLGGRLLTFVDAPEDVFGETTQVGINIMSDNTLRAVRAALPGTGIVLRGLDQAGDSQVVLLGASPSPVPASAYMEIKVVHHPTTGSIQVWINNSLFWALTNINTAISGRNQSTQVLWGGYASNGPSDQVRHLEDLRAVISGIIVINTVAVAGDANEPVDRMGDYVPLLSLPTADAFYAQFTPDPVQDHFLNVDEVPPDSGTTENSAGELDLRDNFAMEDPAGEGANQVYLAYTGLVRTDVPNTCGVSGAPAEFQFMVLCVSPEPGTVTTDPEYIDECALSDFSSRRFETVCTIARDGESVTFKEFGMDFTEQQICLTPLSNPPFLCQRDFSGAATELVFNNSRNMQTALGDATYSLPFFSPWAGYALGSNVTQAPTAVGDKVEFKLNAKGVSIDVGFVASAYDVALFPYTPVEAAFHFRWDLPSDPFFFCSTTFPYQGETTFSYEATDLFSITLTATAYELRQNNILVATITPDVMPPAVFVYCFAGRWRYNELTSSYDVPPGIDRCVAYVSGTGCVNCGPVVPLVTEGAFPAPPAIPGPYHRMEVTQWGLYMQGFEGFGQIFDPSVNEGPSSGIPEFEWNLDTSFTFKLEGGNVVLEITDFVSLDGIPEVGGKGVYTYSRPYADTDDFFLQPPADGWPVGLPVDGNPTLDKTMAPTAASTPLRLAGLFPFDEPQGLTDVSFQFVAAAQVNTFAGFMRQTATDRDGTPTTAPNDYAYRQSFLSTAPDDGIITLDKFNAAEHGYHDPE